MCYERFSIGHELDAMFRGVDCMIQDMMFASAYPEVMVLLIFFLPWAIVIQHVMKQVRLSTRTVLRVTSFCCFPWFFFFHFFFFLLWFFSSPGRTRHDCRGMHKGPACHLVLFLAGTGQSLYGMMTPSEHSMN